MDEMEDMEDIMDDHSEDEDVDVTVEEDRDNDDATMEKYSRQEIER